MRNAVGIFGLVCGAIVIWTVGTYGYSTADDPSARWNMAFLFGVIATGGLFGHAVSVRLWRVNRAWSIILGAACFLALVINLANSIGALAGRADRSTTEATGKASAIKDDRAELARLQKALDRVGEFVPTDQSAVAAAKRAADAATASRSAECGNGDPKQRGRHCRAKEDDEKAALDRLSAASAAKAKTERAAEIEGQMAPVRDRLRTAGAAPSTNVQGKAIATLFRLPDGEAGFVAVLNHFLIAAVVELLIVLSMVAFELLAPPVRQATDAPATQDAEAEPAEPIRTLPPPPKPRLVAAREGPPVGSVPRIMTAALERARGQRVTLDTCYARYKLENKGAEPVTADQFMDAMAKFCRDAGIKTKITTKNLYLLDVQLAEPVHMPLDKGA